MVFHHIVLATSNVMVGQHFSRIGVMVFSSVWVRSAVVVGAVCSLAVVGAGVGSGTPLESKSQTVTTDDGWLVGVEASNLSVNPVPNLAGSTFTREGFVSAKVTAMITGEGTAAVRTGIIEQGIQIGCGVDVSNGATLGLAASFGPNVGITMAGPSVGLSATAGPNVSMQVKPGAITTIPMGEKVMEGPRASISANNIHVKIDGCWGEVTVRTYAMVAVSTATADESVFVYSEPTWL